MGISSVVTSRVSLPKFSEAKPPSPLSSALYKTRLANTVDRIRRAHLDVLLLYADREHSANVAYLTGFEPRFEEALLMISAEGNWKLLVGNECLSFLPDVKGLNLEVELFQDFSLLGQSREASRPLKRIFRDFGIGRSRRVGCVGWKYFNGSLVPGGIRALDVPSYIADAVRELTADPAQLVNATGIFMDARDGLRIINEPAQIAQFEYASCITSEGVLRVLTTLRPGVREELLEKHLETRGIPLSCHRMISFGDKAQRGLASPSPARASLGAPFTIGFGVQGALTCRAGMVARDQRELPSELRQFYPELARNYFQVVATWYEKVRVGAQARAVVQAVDRVRNRKLYDFAVNPGHYLHLDEWVHSPFTDESEVRLRSGMMLQMDIIPVSRGPFCCTNAEDGIVLADDTLQQELENSYPEVWRRIVARREFMRTELNIQIHDSLLPLSNIPGWLPPFAMDLNKAFVALAERRGGR